MKYFQGTRSPNEAERELNGYSLAWMHHKGRNRHHFEYWIDVDPVEKIYKPVKMPLRFLAEMFCDRVAASKIYRGENTGIPTRWITSCPESLHVRYTRRPPTCLKSCSACWQSRGRKLRSLISGSWLRQVRNTKILQCNKQTPPEAAVFITAASGGYIILIQACG